MKKNKLITILSILLLVFGITVLVFKIIINKNSKNIDNKEMFI